jgi:hypothetical protein
MGEEREREFGKREKRARRRRPERVCPESERGAARAVAGGRGPSARRR